MLDNKNIENFIKKRLEKEDFAFNEDHWKQLETRLDANEKALAAPGSNGHLVKTLLAVAGAVLIFIAGWFANSLLSKKETPLDTNAIVKTTSIKVDTSAKASNVISGNEKNVSESEEKNTFSKTTTEVEAQSKNDESETTVGASQQVNIRSVDENDVKKGIEAPQGFEKSSKVSIQDAHKNDFAPEEKKTTSYSTNTRKAPWFFVSQMTLEGESINGVILNDSTEEKQNKSTKSFSYTLGLFVAPDFNATSFNQLFNNIGEMVGADFQVEIKDKFRFGIGVIYNNKSYTAFGTEYSPPKGFWTNGIVPDNTEATCEALDIPISVGYKVLNLPKQRIWLNTGFSSYWLLKENYSFIYDNPDPSLVQGWSGENENFSLVGSLNFSFMYEQRLFEKLSLTVEPYYKVPLKGIGHGSVDLISGGVKIGVLYRFKPLPHKLE